MKEDRDSFIEELADNTPNEGQFDKMKEAEVHDAEEDLLAGKTFKKLNGMTATVLSFLSAFD